MYCKYCSVYVHIVIVRPSLGRGAYVYIRAHKVFLYIGQTATR